MSTSSTSSTDPTPSSPGGSTTGSPMPSVRSATVITHGRPELVAPAVQRVREVAEQAGVAIVDEGEPDLAVVLGGVRAVTRRGRLREGGGLEDEGEPCTAAFAKTVGWPRPGQ